MEGYSGLQKILHSPYTTYHDRSGLDMEVNPSLWLSIGVTVHRQGAIPTAQQDSLLQIRSR